jgi:hypothetical protein
VNSPSSRHTHRQAQADPEHIVDHPRQAAHPANDFFPLDPADPVNPDPLAGGPIEDGGVEDGPVDGVLLEGGPADPGLRWAGTPIEPADEDLDLLADSNRRPGRLTVFLLAGILVAGAFVGGAVAQKHFGAPAAAAASGRQGAAGFGRQFGGTGTFGGGSGGSGGFGGFGGAGGSAAGGSAAGGAAADTPAVVGQVVKVSGTTVTVRNFAGKTVTVKVPAGTAVSLSSALSLSGLKAGTSVSVVGTKAADGSITASAVTARK